MCTYYEKELKASAVKLRLANKEIVDRLLVQKCMRMSTHYSLMFTGPHIVYRDILQRLGRPKRLPTKYKNPT
jgi:hypothetical protein